MPPFEFLGPYRIGEPLGHGGMGTVYRAIHEKTKEPVAVKLIAAHVADDQKFRRRFSSEIRTLESLRHEGIVRLIGHGEKHGQPFYSMELVEGELLQARIKRLKKLDWKSTIDIAIQICAALKHAHDFGVIHRDLKPANLILTKNDRVKLFDFGIAKIFGDSHHTVIGSILGTADYMAPEQVTSSGITVRTDLYALGSVMYAMLTGRPPFSGKSTTEVIQSLERDRPVPLDIINPELPEALVELVHQLLEKDPADRPPTALAVMNRLKAMRAGLERAQTLHGPTSPTTVSPGSGGTGDTASNGIKSDSYHGTNVSDDPTLIRRSDDLPTNGVEKPADPLTANPLDSPTKQTVVSDTRTSKTIPPGIGRPVSTKSESHFKTVDDHESPASVFAGGRDSHWSQWTAAAIVFIILAAGAALFLLAMRPPSAEQLYIAATQEQDAGAKQAFLSRFPDDPRAAEIYELVMADRVRGAINRLTAQSKLGLAPLSAAEEGFLAAMRRREEAPRESSEKLRQWLNAFDNDTNRNDANLLALIDLAEHEQSRLATTEPAPKIDARVAELMQQIDAAEASNDQREIRKRLNGIIETFEHVDWASPAVERARNVLSQLSGE